MGTPCKATLRTYLIPTGLAARYFPYGEDLSITGFFAAAGGSRKVHGKSSGRFGVAGGLVTRYNTPDDLVLGGKYEPQTSGMVADGAKMRGLIGITPGMSP